MTRVVAELTPAYGPETPVVVAYRVSWPDQQLIRGTLGTIAGLVQAAGIERQALDPGGAGPGGPGRGVQGPVQAL